MGDLDRIEVDCGGIGLVVSSGCLRRHPDAQDGLAEWRVLECSTLEVQVHPAHEACQVWLGDQRFDAQALQGDLAYCLVKTGNFVGASRLRVDLGGRTLHEVALEVQSRKVDYLTHYRDLLDELARRVSALAFTGFSPTSAPATPEPGQSAPFLTYLVLQYWMNPRRLPAALHRIARHPDRRLVNESILEDFSRARNLTDRTLRHLVSDSRNLVRTGQERLPLLRGHLPQRLLDERTRVDHATPPNRFLALVLGILERQLRELHTLFSVHPAPTAPKIATDCSRWGKRIAGFQRQPFLEEVSPGNRIPLDSPVLQRHEAYRTIRDVWASLQGAARVRWKDLDRVVAAPNKNLALLYEYWCFFALADAVARRVGVEPDWRTLLKTDANEIEVRLARGRRSEVHLGPYRLVYEPRIRSASYSVPLKPDFVLRGEGGVWIFDAKYRLDGELVEAACQDVQGRQGRKFVREDLYKMHTYRDALRGARSAFILYPGEMFMAYPLSGQRTTFASEVERGFQGVGAVPLLPNRVQSLDQLLNRLI